MHDITCLIPVSAIPSHPSTEVLDQTIASIRERLPDSELIIMFDGLTPNNMHLKERYEQFKSKMLWELNTIGNATPIVFDSHSHQTLMTKEVLKLVRTPLILWSEQDTPLHNDIPFDAIAPVLLTGYADVVRFMHEASVLPDHEYLMLDQKPIDILGVPLIRTRQWSGRPHLAKTMYYKVVADNLWGDKPAFIEHKMYGAVVEGKFDAHRIHIYAPSGSLVRSKHLDGRRLGADHYDKSAS